MTNTKVTTVKEKTLARMQELAISPKRSLGQNFLVSDGVIHKIVNAVAKFKPSHVIEIGPGLGALTDTLAESSADGSQAFSFRLIELDRAFSAYWRTRGFEVIEADALQVNWAEILGGHPTVVVSNLPYQISSRLVVELSSRELPLSGLIFMFQREVAQRMVAKQKTKDYGLLSVVAQTFWDISVVTNAGSQDFYPAPQVGSRVLLFKARSARVEKSEQFVDFVKRAFSQRRKYLIKNLGSGHSLPALQAAFEAGQISLQARAEDLSIDSFIDLFLALRVLELKGKR